LDAAEVNILMGVMHLLSLTYPVGTRRINRDVACPKPHYLMCYIKGRPGE